MVVAGALRCHQDAHQSDDNTNDEGFLNESLNQSLGIFNVIHKILRCGVHPCHPCRLNPHSLKKEGSRSDQVSQPDLWDPI